MRRSPNSAVNRLLLAALCVLGLVGCEKSAPSNVVTLYCSVDEPFAREVVAAFEKQSGIRVNLKTDTEAGKTTGLVRLIEAERAHPQADVFWSSELFNTIKMANDGLLAEYRPPTEGIPDRYKDSAGKWTAFGDRARVLAWNAQKVKKDAVPAKWRDIADPRWMGQLGLADPRFGTTRGHLAAMYTLWGEAEYVKFLDELQKTLAGRLLDGNATAARLVGTGELSIGATDTDDAYARQERKEPVELAFPDMGDGGTLLIPNSVGLLTGAPHLDAARKLIDFLCSEGTEEMLARSESRNIPVRESLRAKLKMEAPASSKVDFQKVTTNMDRAITLAGERLVK
jgi:iron(III) transport system substrate-binding protein